MKKLGRREWILLGLLVLTLAVTGLIAGRAYRRAVYWREHRDEKIRPWMSVGYVSHSHRVPSPVLYRAIGVEPSPRDRRPIRAIAAQQGRPVEALISDLERAIADFRSSHPPPGRAPLINGGASP